MVKFCEALLYISEYATQYRDKATPGTIEVMPSRLHLLSLAFPSQYLEGRGGKRLMDGQPYALLW